MNNIIRLLKVCRDSESNFLYVAIVFVYYKLIHKKSILAHHKSIIKGINNLKVNGILQLGISQNDLSMKNDKTQMKIDGKLHVHENYSIGRGCRIAIGKNAKVDLYGGYININSIIVIKHGLTIGKGSAISWNCQILDDDFHEIVYENKTNVNQQIIIGNHVWIGSNVSIFKGVIIPNNCVVAANSVITKKFETENCLIAGNPAKIIRQNINWK